MLRRLHDEDRQDGSPVRYWLHRVQIHLNPGDLAPDVGEELADFMGNVPLSMLHERGGARAVRYVNTNEAHGSISVAIDPAVIATVATIEIPVESVAVETAAAAAASAQAATALAEVAHRRPDTTGIDDISLRFPAKLPDANLRIPQTQNANVSKPSQNSSTRQVQPIDPRMGTTPLFGYCVLTEEFLVLVGGRDSRNHPVDQLRSVDELGERGRVDGEAGRLRELVF